VPALDDLDANVLRDVAPDRQVGLADLNLDRSTQEGAANEPNADARHETHLGKTTYGGVVPQAFGDHTVLVDSKVVESHGFGLSREGETCPETGAWYSVGAPLASRVWQAKPRFYLAIRFTWRSALPADPFQVPIGPA